MSIAVALMWENTWLRGLGLPGASKRPSPLCLGSRPPLAEQPRGLGRGLPLPPTAAVAPFVRFARGLGRPGGGRGCSERLREEPGEKWVQRGDHSLSHGLGVLPLPDQISFKFVVSLLLLPTQKTAKIKYL